MAREPNDSCTTAPTTVGRNGRTAATPPAALASPSGQSYADLAPWYVLAWSGESLRRGPGPIAALMAKGGNFELADREALVSEIGKVL